MSWQTADTRGSVEEGKEMRDGVTEGLVVGGVEGEGWRMALRKSLLRRAGDREGAEEEADGDVVAGVSTEESATETVVAVEALETMVVVEGLT